LSGSNKVAASHSKSSTSSNGKEIEKDVKTDTTIEPAVKKVDNEVRIQSTRIKRESNPTPIEETSADSNFLSSASGSKISGVPRTVATIPIRISKEIDMGETPVRSKSVDTRDKPSIPTVDKNTNNNQKAPRTSIKLTTEKSNQISTDKKDEVASINTNSQLKKEEPVTERVAEVIPSSSFSKFSKAMGVKPRMQDKGEMKVKVEAVEPMIESKALPVTGTPNSLSPDKTDSSLLDNASASSEVKSSKRMKKKMSASKDASDEVTKSEAAIKTADTEKEVSSNKVAAASTSEIEPKIEVHIIINRDEQSVICTTTFLIIIVYNYNQAKPSINLRLKTSKGVSEAPAVSTSSMDR
jgi:hypothetical protein